MGYESQQQGQQVTFTTKLVKTQMSTLAKSLIYSGLGFLLVCGFGYLINFLLLNPEKIGGYQFANNVSTLNTVSSVLLVVTTIILIVYSFMRSNWIMTSVMYCLIIASFSISFSFLFTVNNLSDVLFVFALAGATMLVSGGIAYIIKDKTAFTLMKIMGIMSIIYFVATLIFMLVSIFSFNHNSVLYIILTIFMMVLIFLGNISTFYQIRKIDQFCKLTNQSNALISFQLGLNLLISILNIVIIIMNLLRLFKN